jgi:hypothetical protein
MKLKGQTIVMVPWFDSDGMKQWLRLSFRGKMDERFMYRQVVAYIKREFNKTVDKKWIKATCPIINEFKDHSGKEKYQGLSDTTAFNSMVEDWIKRLESDEDEDKSDTILPQEDHGTPELPVQPVSDTDRR